jgi:F-type H+-transporting ATPase subunit a
MAETNTDLNISDNINSQQNQNSTTQNHQVLVSQQSTTISQPVKPATESKGEAKNDVFSELFGELGDHHGIIIGPYHIADLPMIIYDDGLHIYSSPASMEKAGLYTMHNTHPVRSIDHKAPKLDLSVTNLVFFEWIALLILGFLFFRGGGKARKNPSNAPSGVTNLIESVLVYIRKEIVRPNLPTIKIADRLLPYFSGLFFFILTCNLFGLIPGGHTATGTLGVTAGLAITAFFVINFTAIRESGIGAWFKHLLGGAPWYLFFIMIPIEIISMFVKPFALTIRLFANMSAGHIVLLSLLGLLFYFRTIYIAPAIVGFSIFIYLLELLVAFIQAYVFTMLTAIFVGLAIGEHGHTEESLEHN